MVGVSDLFLPWSPDTPSGCGLVLLPGPTHPFSSFAFSETLQRDGRYKDRKVTGMYIPWLGKPLHKYVTTTKVGFGGYVMCAHRCCKVVPGVRWSTRTAGEENDCTGSASMPIWAVGDKGRSYSAPQWPASAVHLWCSGTEQEETAAPEHVREKGQTRWMNRVYFQSKRTHKYVHCSPRLKFKQIQTNVNDV